MVNVTYNRTLAWKVLEKQFKPPLQLSRRFIAYTIKGFVYCIQERQEIARELEEKRKQEESKARKVCVWQLDEDEKNFLEIGIY